MSEPTTSQIAEIVGVVFESLSALSAANRQQHLTHLLWHSRDEATPGTEAFAFFENEHKQANADLERANVTLHRSLRKLEAIKLGLEGKTPEEIQATFAERDSAVAAFVAEVRPGQKDGTASVPAER